MTSAIARAAGGERACGAQGSASADVAAYTARLHLLASALHDGVAGAHVGGSEGAATQQAQRVLAEVVGCWRDIKAAQAARAAEEAELFRSKARDTAIATVEVLTLRLIRGASCIVITSISNGNVFCWPFLSSSYVVRIMRARS